VIEPHKTYDLSDSKPTKGNIAGDLTTIVEKARGGVDEATLCASLRSRHLDA
jgi:(2R)-sulfolactate sulfo-lyase subunit beta